MIWQDFVLFTASVYFGAALIPAIMDEDVRWPVSSSAPTAIGLYTIGIVYYTLNLHVAASGALFTGAVWTFIAKERRT